MVTLLIYVLSVTERIPRDARETFICEIFASLIYVSCISYLLIFMVIDMRDILAIGFFQIYDKIEFTF